MVSQITWTIGELAARTGLPVKTVRYYSDIGLLPLSGRSPGGHRRYAPEALNHLTLIQQLRALGTPIATITQVTTGERSLADLVAEALDRTRSHLAELQWRQATLEALDDCSDQERLRRLTVLSRVQRLPDARLDLARAWERMIPRDVPAHLTDLITSQAVPDPPRDPSPQSVLAYAELHTLVEHPGFRGYWTPPAVRDRASLYSAQLDASLLASAAVASGLPPQRGEALNRFTGACARAKGVDDTPLFRASMREEIRPSLRPFRLYWQHIATLRGDTPFSLGSSHCWLAQALVAEQRRVPAKPPGGADTPPGQPVIAS
ncbi:helix-turn-helix domain-containing protein [Streptomyces sp. NPDC001985]|uniref:helix-turn-helix domain-containing protein n=1 Tax=Streptomyces sp. NPDC001985 TaxID=3154406 RepID=UPI0033343A1A